MRDRKDDGGRTLLWGSAALTVAALVAEAAEAWGVADWPLPCGMTLGQAATAMAVGAMLASMAWLVAEEVRRAR